MGYKKYKKETGRIVFKTPDGSLIMNRLSETSYWDDDEFIQYSLATDARIKGVKIIKYTVDPIECVIDAVVTWL